MSRGPRLPNYSLKHRIGKGSFADVYLGHCNISGEQYAIKIFGDAEPTNESTHPSDAHEIHYRTELQILSSFTHPNLVRLHDAGRIPASRTPFIALEFIQGEDFISASINVSKRHFIDLLVQMCRVLDHLHRNEICHGDLKPQNALVIRNPDTPSRTPTVKLIDLASANVGTRVTSQITQGSPFYIAPEVLRGQPQSNLSDLYSLGAILYECLEGAPPHNGHSTSEILQAHLEGRQLAFQDGALVELHPLILQLLESNPAKRPSSANEVVSQLNRTMAPTRRFALRTPDTLAIIMGNPPLVERETTIKRMHNYLDWLLREHNRSSIRSVVVKGPTGIGKTRILEETLLAARLRGIDTISINGRCQASITTALSSTSNAGNRFPSLSPMVITLDEPELDVCEIQQLARQAMRRDPRPLLIVATKETNAGLSEAHRYDDVVVELLTPLSTEGVYKTLGQSFGPDLIPKDTCMKLNELSGGNPQVTWDLVIHSLDEENLNNSQTIRLNLDHTLDCHVSNSNRMLFDRWMGAISSSDTSMMRFLAISEEALSAVDLANITSQPADILLTRCNHFQEAGLLLRHHTGSTPRFTLSARLFRQHILKTIDVEELRQLHENLARWHMENSGKRNAATLAAPHFVAAEMRETAFNAYLAAAEYATEIHDDIQAVAIYERALALRPDHSVTRAELALRFSDSLSRVGRATEAWDLLDQLCGTDELSLKMRIEVLTRKALFSGRQGRFPEMKVFSHEALTIAKQQDLRTEMIYPLLLFGSSLCWLEQWEEGKRALFRATYLARRHQMRSDVADTLVTVALALWRTGNYRLALNYERRRLRLLPPNGQPWPVATAHSNIGILLADLGRYRSARRYQQESLRISRRFSLKPHLAATHVNIGETHRSQGSWARALRQYDKAIDVLGDTGSEHASPIAHANASHVLVRTGYIQEAIARLRHNLRRFSSSGARQVPCITHLGWGYILYSTGKLRLAHKVAAHACAIAEGVQLWSMILECKTLMALALAGLGKAALGKPLLQDAIRRYVDRSPFDARLAARLAAIEIDQRVVCTPESALSALEPLISMARTRRMRWHTARGLMLRAQNYLALGRGSEAESDLVEVLEHAQKVSDRSIAWRAAYLLGRVHEQALHYEKALAAYRESSLTIHELEMNIEDEKYRTAFARQPEVIEAREAFQRLNAEVGAQARHDVVTLHRSEQASRKMLASLSAIGQTLSSILDLDKLLERLLDLAIDNVGAERGVVFLLDPSTGEMQPTSARGASGESLADISTYSRSVIRRAANGEALVTLDVGKEPSLSGYESLVLHSIKSILCIPMRTQGAVIGVIYLDTQRAAQLFTEKERAFVESFASQAAIAIENARIFGRMREDNLRLRREVRQQFGSLIGTSPAMRRLKDLISSVLGSDCNVLISGESGTGKELVARAIHQHGQRQGKPFLAVDCGALPDTLLEAELFGHARGAFTGADRERTGLFEAADGGTLFLDEITNTSLPLQARLLRVLQEREIRRVGENRSRRVDVRIIAATNADLKAMMEEGGFRRDLYYRLNVMDIEVPPLRRRREDIPLLVRHFLSSHPQEGRHPLRISQGALSALSRHDWPGNVRELENTVERLALLSSDGVISDAGIPPCIHGSTAAPGPSPGKTSMPKSGEQAMIEEALRFTTGDKAKAARYIGWNRQKLYRKMRVYSIPKDFGKAA